MFKLVTVLSLLGVACAAPGGLTGHIVDHGLGHIHAPNVVDHGHPHHVSVIAQPEPVHAPALHAAPLHVEHHHSVPVIHYPAPVVHAPLHGHLELGHGHEEIHAPHHQPPAPHVHVHPIVTKTVLPSHDHYVPVHHHAIH
ncbi:histidine-rich glycoprotein-like [Phymastichus coffea]|uniref:histidine-rich glycoprotein-like n=1 Tax=Phymastichus coffea TaxID=108790 RepID=UPI00273BA2FA|nr:histidine-rich glycoprotein-like [Phymastichus coffea]